MARQAGLVQRLQSGRSTGGGTVVQRVMAKGGSVDVNPEFSSGNQVVSRIEQFYKLGDTKSTVGIAKESVLTDAGDLWQASDAPEGKARVYKTPVDKGKPRGWQANFWERPADGGEPTHNFHVSMRS